MDAVRPYVAKACTYVRSVGGGRCYADVREARETVVFLDIRVVPKADAAPLLDIPRASRVVQECVGPPASLTACSHMRLNRH